MRVEYKRRTGENEVVLSHVCDLVLVCYDVVASKTNRVLQGVSGPTASTSTTASYAIHFGIRFLFALRLYKSQLFTFDRFVHRALDEQRMANRAAADNDDDEL